jgi:hypothetical protein
MTATVEVSTGTATREALRERAMEGALLQVAGAAAQPASPASPPAHRRAVSSGDAWLEAQGLNGLRHAAALRPFRREEFGTGPESPSEGHVRVINDLISNLRRELVRRSAILARFSHASRRRSSTERVQRLLRWKEHTHHAVQSIERIWDFYLELFGQRQSRYGPWLLGCDRIALDCYQSMYMGLARHQSIPAPPPWNYMRTGFSPSTYRRGIFLRRIGFRNPFPLIQLPYHRMVNPWTLGAVLHELSHNFQSDLGLDRTIPRVIAKRLLAAGLPREVVRTWVRWNRETFADLNGLLLGGPAIVASLMDVLGRAPKTVTRYLPNGPHPTPRLRALISTHLLHRMKFPQEAAQYERTWLRMYPSSQRGNIPEAVWKTFPEARELVVDAICYRPLPELGGKTLAQVSNFSAMNQQMIEEAAARLAAGNDPGVIPARFLIGASRIALDRKLATPSAIAKNFYLELVRR